MTADCIGLGTTPPILIIRKITKMQEDLHNFQESCLPLSISKILTLNRIKMLMMPYKDSSKMWRISSIMMGSQGQVSIQ